MRLPALIAGLGLMGPCLTMAAAEPADPRAGAYQQFRADFDASRYSAALPEARRVVDLTREQFGADSPEMANPLTNLATTYYRMGEYERAIDTYREVLTLLDGLGNATDQRLVRPLHGIGATLQAMQRHADSLPPLKQAVDIMRHRDGLHAASQMPVLRALINSYMAAGLYEDAGREEQYAFNVAEAAYGRNDIRMLGPLESLAMWNEQTARYSVARALHARAVQIADGVRPNNIDAVPALRGIARTLRLAYINGEVQEPPVQGFGTNSDMLRGVVTIPSGDVSLRNALQRIDGARHAALRGAVLIELGDWQMLVGSIGQSMNTYREAWRNLAAAGETSALTQPAPVFYRPPLMAVSQRRENTDDSQIQDVELRISVGVNGEVRDTTVANPAPEREAAERAVAMAVRRGRWRPAFQDGEPVAVSDFLFREPVYIRRPRS